jgi:hypothetical protein
MKQNKKVYVLTLEEQYHSITDMLVLGTFSNERSAKEVMEKTFEDIYNRDYSNLNKNDYIITKSTDKMTISEILCNNYTILKITETILDKWEK